MLKSLRSRKFKENANVRSSFQIYFQLWAAIKSKKLYIIFYSIFRENDENDESSISETESFAEVSESDLIALALSPNADDDGPKLASLPSDSTLNSVSLADADGAQGYTIYQIFLSKAKFCKI